MSKESAKKKEAGVNSKSSASRTNIKPAKVIIDNEDWEEEIDPKEGHMERWYDSADSEAEDVRVRVKKPNARSQQVREKQSDKPMSPSRNSQEESDSEEEANKKKKPTMATAVAGAIGGAIGSGIASAAIAGAVESTGAIINMETDPSKTPKGAKKFFKDYGFIMAMVGSLILIALVGLAFSEFKAGKDRKAMKEAAQQRRNRKTMEDAMFKNIRRSEPADDVHHRTEEHLRDEAMTRVRADQRSRPAIHHNDLPTPPRAQPAEAEKTNNGTRTMSRQETLYAIDQEENKMALKFKRMEQEYKRDMARYNALRTLKEKLNEKSGTQANGSADKERVREKAEATSAQPGKDGDEEEDPEEPDADSDKQIVEVKEEGEVEQLVEEDKKERAEEQRAMEKDSELPQLKDPYLTYL